MTGLHPSFVEARDGDTPVIGGWMMIDSPMVAETLFGLGYRYVGIDTEHSLMTVPDAVRHLYAARPGGVATLIRVGANDVADIGRVLDGGADGVIVPMVDTADQAAAAVAACRYHAGGKRSFGPYRRGLGADPAMLEARAACFVMIETEAGLDAVDRIAAVDGLAGLYAGPGDLAVGLGLPVSQVPTAGPLREALTRIARAARSAGLIAGIHAVSVEQAMEFASFGYGMITLGADVAYLGSAAAAALQDMNAALARGSADGSRA